MSLASTLRMARYRTLRDYHAGLARVSADYTRQYGESRAVRRSSVDSLWRHNGLRTPGLSGLFCLCGAAGAGDYFGESLAAGNLGYDGYDDLAIGIPNRTVMTAKHAGAIRIVFGSASGLGFNSHDIMLTMGAQAQEGDGFGRHLSAAKFGGDGFIDLAVGIPQLAAGGAVRVYYGSPTGPQASPNQKWTADTPGVPGETEPYARFGHGLSK